MSVESPIAGEALCEELRAAGIKCACVELPSEPNAAAPAAYLGFAQAPTEWTVLVHESDLERARELLGERLEP
jgi:hypothetical protein